jgi:uncharacterized phage-associated protein
VSGWSPEIANEFIALAKARGTPLTQMQLQKLIFIAHGWNLAIANERLTIDSPRAWDYGPVYRDLWEALKKYGSSPVEQPILCRDYVAGLFHDEPDSPAKAALNGSEKAIIGRVFSDYGRFHAFQLSALTHVEGSPWSTIYAGGAGKDKEIPDNLIKGHFIELARARPA